MTYEMNCGAHHESRNQFRDSRYPLVSPAMPAFQCRESACIPAWPGLGGNVVVGMASGWKVGVVQWMFYPGAKATFPSWWDNPLVPVPHLLSKLWLFAPALVNTFLRQGGIRLYRFGMGKRSTTSVFLQQLRNRS